MSRLWDTPEFWVRTEVDDMLRDFPVLTADALADRFEHSRRYRDSDPDFVRQVTVELRRRAYARVRFWPDLAEWSGTRLDAGGSSHAMSDHQLAASDGTDFWWQRI